MDDDDKQPMLIYTTWPDAAQAEAAARRLVTNREAACVNVLGAATAIYSWQGEAQRDVEYPMLIKTRRDQVSAVVERVRRVHPYDVPAIAAWPLDDGAPEFLAWITLQTAPLEAADDKDGNDDAE